MKYSLNGHYTTQEDQRLQPQNRFGLKLQLGKWWTLDAGHIYPDMGNFTISGRRMFGVNTEVHLLWENINIELLYGEINRKVTNLYAGIAVDTVKAGVYPKTPPIPLVTIVQVEGALHVRLWVLVWA